jgi:hypothetical protein
MTIRAAYGQYGDRWHMFGTNVNEFGPPFRGDVLCARLLPAAPHRPLTESVLLAGDTESLAPRTRLCPGLCSRQAMLPDPKSGAIGSEIAHFGQQMPLLVESRKSAVRGPLAAARFPSPLIKPDVPSSSIRLSNRLHHQLTEVFATKRSSTPSFPNTTRSGNWAVPSEDPLSLISLERRFEAIHSELTVRRIRPF